MSPRRAPAERTVLSLDGILDAAVALLDEGGEKELTFRALASRLGAGPASVYWYVKDKDELLSLATGRVVAEAVRAADPAERRSRATTRADSDSAAVTTGTTDPDPLEDVRRLSLALFTELDRHPWAGSRLMADVDAQLDSLTFMERVGASLTTLGLDSSDCFHGATAVVNYVVGVGTQMAQSRFRLPEPVRRDEFLESTAARWRALDPERFPYLTSAVEEFRGHSDETQFTRGLDYLLAGLAARARPLSRRDR